jgi:hypothetical protein
VIDSCVERSDDEPDPRRRHDDDGDRPRRCGRWCGARSTVRGGRTSGVRGRERVATRKSARAVITQALGDADVDQATCERVREIVTDTGALAAVENEIDALLEVALEGAAQLDPPSRESLARLARLVAERRS